jgi:hypothetical protein
MDITAVGLTEITSTDFPFLTKITGGLQIGGLHSNDGSNLNLQTVTFSKLEAVEGTLSIISNVIFGDATGPATELHLPALTSIGKGLGLITTTLRVLDLPSLHSVNGGVSPNFPPLKAAISCRISRDHA